MDLIARRDWPASWFRRHVTRTTGRGSRNDGAHFCLVVAPGASPWWGGEGSTGEGGAKEGNAGSRMTFAWSARFYAGAERVALRSHLPEIKEGNASKAYLSRQSNPLPSRKTLSPNQNRRLTSEILKYFDAFPPFLLCYVINPGNCGG